MYFFWLVCENFVSWMTTFVHTGQTAKPIQKPFGTKAATVSNVYLRCICFQCTEITGSMMIDDAPYKLSFYLLTYLLI